MRKSQNIKYLVFKGGGVLGIAYAGAIKVLEKEGLLKNIKGTAGTSAGSIVSALVSFNHSADEISAIIKATNFKDFEDKRNYIRIVRKYGLYKGQFFLTWMKNIIQKKTGKGDITFGEMASGKYGEFKKLKVYATHLDTMNLTEFSAKETPDVIVAEAIRASMSIPLFFKAWRFPSGIPDSSLYVDGGAIYNYPINAYDDLSKTLGFFLKSSKKIKPLKYNRFSKYVSRVFRTVLKAQTIDFMESQTQVDDTVFISNLGISATDFGLDDDDKTNLFNEGEKETTKYLKKNIA